MTGFNKNKVEAAIRDLQNGKFIVVFDDESRENEGDLILCGEKVTDEKINFIIKYARGLVCAPISEEIAKQFNLGLMVTDNEDKFGTAYTISVDATEGTTTGISAGDRAKTVKVLADPSKGPTDLIRPGHMFPLLAKKGGLLVRTGHTEASVDLARMAGMREVGVICEIIKDNGEMARWADLEEFAQEHDLTMVSIPDIIKYRLVKETLLEKQEEAVMQMPLGTWNVMTLRDTFKGAEYHALVKGKLDTTCPVPTWVHVGSMTDDLAACMNQMEEQGCGVILWHDCPKSELMKQMQTWTMHDANNNAQQCKQPGSFECCIMRAGMSAQMLRMLGIQQVKLLANNTAEQLMLEEYGINVTERVVLELLPRSFAQSPGKWDQPSGR